MSALFPLLLLVLAIGPQRVDASCAGYDYADEFRLAGFALVSSTPVENGLVEVVISAEISNLNEGDLREIAQRRGQVLQCHIFPNSKIRTSTST